MTTPRLPIALAIAALASASAAAVPIATTIRVEGGSANVLPETQVTVDDTPGATVVVADTTDTDTITVSQRSATAQLGAATVRFGLPLGFDLFQFAPPPAPPTSFVTRIGTDLMPASFTPSWRLKVNGRTAAVGADEVLLSAGDSATWSFVTDFTTRELDLRVSGDALRQGQTLTATVRSIDNDGVAVPAAGATVTFGDQVATADGAGVATFPALGIGVKQIVANRAGEVRSQARSICTYVDDPSVCQLPPAPAAPAARGATDTVPPGSAIAFPVSGRRYAAVRMLRGSAGPDRSDIDRVEVAIARRVGTLCRFMGPRGRFAAARSCTLQRYIPARSSGSRWVFAAPVRLPAGTYRAWSRAIDGAGNRERVGIATVNAISFTILPARRAVR